MLIKDFMKKISEGRSILIDNDSNSNDIIAYLPYATDCNGFGIHDTNIILNGKVITVTNDSDRVVAEFESVKDARIIQLEFLDGVENGKEVLRTALLFFQSVNMIDVKNIDYTDYILSTQIVYDDESDTKLYFMLDDSMVLMTDFKVAEDFLQDNGRITDPVDFFGIELITFLSSQLKIPHAHIYQVLAKNSNSFL